MNYYEVTKRTWNATKELFNSLIYSGDWIFRGQSDYKWKLRTTLENLLVIERLNSSVEFDILKTFQAKANNYLEQQDLPLDYFDWFALMQHHGAPTRLLDWTYSPYVASYFALEKAIENYDYSVVYALNTNTLFEKIKNKIGLSKSNTNDEITAKGIVMGSSVINKVLENNMEIVVAVTPRRFNKRLNSQQGIFVLPGKIDVPFEENLEAIYQNSDEKSLLRILIPTKLKHEILNDLHFMNITPETLFPGIDGLARSMSYLGNWI